MLVIYMFPTVKTKTFLQRENGTLDPSPGDIVPLLNQEKIVNFKSQINWCEISVMLLKKKRC